MGGLLKKLKGKLAKPVVPGAGMTSKEATGIESGARGAKQPDESNQNRRPGRRGADTPLGPGRQRM